MPPRRKSEVTQSSKVNITAFLDKKIYSKTKVDGQFYQEIGPETEVGKLVQKMPNHTYGEILGIFLGDKEGQVHPLNFVSVIMTHRNELGFEPGFEINIPRRRSILEARLEALLYGQHEGVATPREYMAFIKLFMQMADNGMLPIKGDILAFRAQHRPMWMTVAYPDM